MSHSIVSRVLARRAALYSPSARARLGLHQCRSYATDHSTPEPSPSQSPKERLPSEREQSRSEVAKNLSSRLDNLQAVVFNAGQRLNDLTGYSGIEALKKAIEEQEQKVTSSRQAVQQANEDYKTAISQRSASQKEVNELLQRKHSWSSADLERFTSLYRSDHVNEQAEAQAHARLTEAERAADDARTLLSSSILTRYHEEQIWSDKIRRASTWGTWGIMGFNVFLFVVVQLGLEPWKRRRLVGNFEEKVRSVLKEEGMHKDSPLPALPEAVQVEMPFPEAFTAPVTERESDSVVDTSPNSVKAQSYLESNLDTTAEQDATLRALDRNGLYLDYSTKIRRLFSSEELTLRRLDITTIALEGVACGAIVMAAALSLICRK